MAKTSVLTAARLREVLIYDPQTGEFHWVDRSGAHWRGIAGYRNKHPRNKYVIIDIDNNPYYAHRLAWLFVTGEWPKVEIDHINRNGYDNRWSNLRSVTRLQNALNSGVRSDNTSGMRCVNWNKAREYWEVRISNVKIGDFKEKEQAVQIAARVLSLIKRIS